MKKNQKPFLKILWGLFYALFLPGFCFAAPSRVVSLLPSHTEILRALKMESMLIGVSSGESKEVMPSVPRVGGMKPNWELLVSLEPDIILGDVSHRAYQKTFQRLKLPIVYLSATRAQSIEDVFELVKEMAHLMNCSDRAHDLLLIYKKKLNQLQAQAPSLPVCRVYFEIWPKPLQACGPASLQGHLIKRMRSVNILPDSNNHMPLISLEYVADQAPDIILHTGVVTSEQIAKRPGWGKIPAVQKGHVYQVDQDKFTRASLRIIDAWAQLIAIVEAYDK